jgi:uncharacterized protein
MPIPRTICWVPTWSGTHPGVGLEHLVLAGQAADSVVVAVDDDAGPFRLAYQLAWDANWHLRSADLSLAVQGTRRALRLRTDGEGRWTDGDGRELADLDGCIDIDIWPTPFTNSFPILRAPLEPGERRTFRMAWVNGLDLSVHAQGQAYTRVDERTYVFESLDGSGFRAELPVDENGIVLDYPQLFRRVRPPA